MEVAEVRNRDIVEFGNCYGYQASESTDSTDCYFPFFIQIVGQEHGGIFPLACWSLPDRRLLSLDRLRLPTMRTDDISQALLGH
jgi:hypothetical protein